MVIKKINLNNINFSEIALRTHKEDAEHIIDLAEDISKRGLLNLPTIVPAEEKGKYIVTDGARRVTALKLLLAQGKIDVLQTFQIKDVQDELDTLADMVAGNANIRKTANKEYIEALYRLATEGDVSLDNLSKKVGMSIEYIMKLFKTLKLPEEILKQAEKGQVSISNLITLSDLAGKINEEDLTEWVTRAQSEVAKDFAVSVAEELDAIRKTAKAGREEPKFELKPKLKTKDELTILLIQCETAFTKNASSATEARFQLMKEIWQIDEVEAKKQKDVWDKNQAEKEVKKKERKEAREKAKLGDMKESLEKEGFTVSKEDA